MPSTVTNMAAFNLNHFKLVLNFTPTTSATEVESQNETTFFNSENMTTSDSVTNTASSLSEVSNGYRFNRFSNPLISYDYKCGHYLGI